tara:strand:+ start:2390 stop:2599 length:210 start_codon:yes stop_codon:yes gene_type:complete
MPIPVIVRLFTEMVLGVFVDRVALTPDTEIAADAETTTELVELVANMLVAETLTSVLPCEAIGTSENEV